MADSGNILFPPGMGQLGPGGDIQTNDGLAELSNQEISNALLRTSLKGEILRVDRSSVRQCLANQRACSQQLKEMSGTSRVIKRHAAPRHCQ